jgi:hypothetical protein
VKEAKEHKASLTIGTSEVEVRVVQRQMHRTSANEFYSKSRVYVFIADRDPRDGSDESLTAYKKTMKQFATVALTQLASLVPADVLQIAANGKFRYSRTAGCSCGCSPGVIYDAAPIRLNGINSDVFVEVLRPDRDR